MTATVFESESVELAAVSVPSVLPMPGARRHLRSVLILGVLGALGLASSRSYADDFDQITTTHPRASVTVYEIARPNVKQRVTPYPQIKFEPGDRVMVTAGGCVQTGGQGKIWKRYVHPI